MKDCLVSVVVPVYNVEAYLEKCVQSIASQTYQNIEIILVDDGSKDSSPEICDKWAKKDSRVNVIHKINEGAGYARNTGIEVASGKYILFVDSDDYIDPTLVEKCLIRAKNTSSQVVLFGRKFFNDGEIRIDEKNLKEEVYSGRDVQDKILPGFFNYEQGFGVSLWSKFFDLNLIKNHNISFNSEREYLSEDALFLLDYFAYVSSVAVLPEYLYCYNQRNDSLSHKADINRQKKNNRFLEKGMMTIRNNRYSEKVECCFKVRYHIYTLSACKDIFFSELSKNEKKLLLDKIFIDEALTSTLENNVLKAESFAMSVFFRAVKYKKFGICRLLLKLKNQSNRS